MRTSAKYSKGLFPRASHVAATEYKPKGVLSSLTGIVEETGVVSTAPTWLQWGPVIADRDRNLKATVPPVTAMLQWGPIIADGDRLLFASGFEPEAELQWGPVIADGDRFFHVTGRPVPLLTSMGPRHR